MNRPTEQQLNKMLDQARKEVFLGKNPAFLGSILCSLDFQWAPGWDKLVGTDGVQLLWNPDDFLRCDQNERVCTLIHELWHPALLHGIRMENRDPQTWNVACDYRINNNMIADGYKLPNNGYWVFDPDIDRHGIMAEEQIYELLIQKQLPMPSKPMGDLLPGKGDKTLQAVHAKNQVSLVIRAIQAAELAGQAGTVPGGLKEKLSNFLDPVIPWRSALSQWMTDLASEDYSWRKRNRRFPDVYMPSREEQPDGLEHLVYFLDTSGSIDNPGIQRFNSEVKYIHETLRPTKLTVIQFDTQIQNVREFSQEESFEDIEVYGRGGTSMVCVRDWIEKNKPTAAVVFSDMECTPLQPLSVDIPVLFAVLPGGHAQMPTFGKIIYIKD